MVARERPKAKYSPSQAELERELDWPRLAFWTNVTAPNVQQLWSGAYVDHNERSITESIYAEPRGSGQVTSWMAR